jgi:hypothetical protein
MKTMHLIKRTSWTRGIFLTCLLFASASAFSQITPPGYERELQMRVAQNNISRLDRDSIHVIDTVAIFNPETYEETIQVIHAAYSIREFCKTFYGMNDPDILLDGNPHIIIDPKTYEDITIRLTPDNKIVVEPK